jgi:hypothetical protein
MMDRGLRLLLGLLLVTIGGALAPPVCLANLYLLFAAQASGTRCQIYVMDGQGNLMLREEQTVGWDAHNITASPDGRMVVVSTASEPMMSIFFVEGSRTLAPPLYLNNPYPPNYYQYMNPVAFHSILPLFYVGMDPIASYRYSVTQSSVEPTSQTVRTGAGFPSYTMGYSPW